jgi:uncharacterized protein YggE
MKSFRYLSFLFLIIASSTYAQRTIKVFGEGVSKARPDIVIITLTTLDEDKTPQGVYAKHPETEKKLRSVLAGHGVTNEHIKQRTYAVKPKLENHAEGPPKVVGYTYFSLYELTITNFPSIPSIMDAVASLGGSNIIVESFKSSRIDELKDRAMKYAITDAKAKGVKIAQEIGYNLGSIMAVEELKLEKIEPKEGDITSMMEKLNPNEVKEVTKVSVLFSLE